MKRCDDLAAASRSSPPVARDCRSAAFRPLSLGGGGSARFRWLLAWGAALSAVGTISPSTGHAQSPTQKRQDEILKKVRWDQKLNGQVPLDLTFKDDTGRSLQLHELFRRKPVMMMLIQYRCTMLCSEEMKVLADSLKQMKFTVGNQFRLVIVSIDSRETPDLAAHYKKGFVKDYGRPGAAEGWQFLTGDERSIRRLADALGYRFVYDAGTDQFAHPDGVVVLTPEGRSARYFFQLNYPPRDLRLALVEAADRKIGSPLDVVALWCFHYNPVTGQYNLALMGVLRLAAIASVLLLGTGVLLMGFRGRRRSSAFGVRSSVFGPTDTPNTQHRTPPSGGIE